MNKSFEFFNLNIPNELLYSIGKVKSGIHGIEIGTDQNGFKHPWISLFHLYQMIYDEKKGICKSARIKSKLIRYDNPSGRVLIEKKASEDKIQIRKVVYLVDGEGREMTIYKYPLDWLFNFCIGQEEQTYYEFLDTKLTPEFFEPLTKITTQNKNIFDNKQILAVDTYKDVFYSNPSYFIYFSFIYIYPVLEITFKSIYIKSRLLRDEFKGQKLDNIGMAEIMKYLEKLRLISKEENNIAIELRKRRNVFAHHGLPEPKENDTLNILAYAKMSLKCIQYLINTKTNI